VTNLYKALYLKFSKGLGPIRIKKLIEEDKLSIDFEVKSVREKVEKEIEKIDKIGCNTVTIFDNDYPELLKNIPDPPVVLYYKGFINDKNLLAVVGTRKPSLYGLKACEYIIPNLVKNNLGIVSGLAIGIDTIAHNTTLKSGGYTIAVLGSGIDKIYPRTNMKVAENILEKGGCILTEFDVGTEASYYTFPSRNRIISGLSLGTLIIEASISSGALITAKIAAEQGRVVFAVPGPILKDSFLGNNTLIREGGILIRDAEDIVKELNISFSRESLNLELTEEESIIYNSIEQDTDLDTIIQKTSLGTSKVLSIISNLIVKDIVVETGGLYSRKS